MMLIIARKSHERNPWLKINPIDDAGQLREEKRDLIILFEEE